jgi:release factor glutamine methyltransferase
MVTHEVGKVLGRKQMRPDTIAARLAGTRQRLNNAGIASARLDARLIVQHATGLSHEQLVANEARGIREGENRLIEELVERRLKHEPVSRLIGEREFYGRSFRISRHVLDPRPETETLVDVALSLSKLGGAKARPGRIADLGTGSGAIIISVLAELPWAAGVASDITREALAVARENSLRHKVANRLELLEGSWFQGFTGEFDLILSNPPYIAEQDLPALPPEVRLFDPKAALNGGSDGLDAYREIAKGSRQYLRIGGHLCLEIGRGQENEVREIILGEGLRPSCKASVETPDLGGRVRVLTFERGPEKVTRAGGEK